LPHRDINHNYHRRYGRIADANTTLDEAWELCRRVPAIREYYEGQAELFK
jgi:hypothetical protein